MTGLPFRAALPAAVACLLLAALQGCGRIETDREKAVAAAARATAGASAGREASPAAEPADTSRRADTAAPFADYDAIADSLDALPGIDTTAPGPHAAFAPDHDSALVAALLPGAAHSEEVLKDAAERAWIGIFQDSLRGRHVARTRVTLERVHDPVVDEDTSVKSGIAVLPAHRAFADILVEDRGLLREGPVEAIDLGGASLLPGEGRRFRLLGVDYEFFATARTGTDIPDGDRNRIRGYRLFLSARSGGTTTTQLLLENVPLNDKEVLLLLGGDFDADGRLDLLLDVAAQSNVETPALFLSRPAAPGKLLRYVASHSRTGC